MVFTTLGRALVTDKLEYILSCATVTTKLKSQWFYTAKFVLCSCNVSTVGYEVVLLVVVTWAPFWHLLLQSERQRGQNKMNSMRL